MKYFASAAALAGGFALAINTGAEAAPEAPPQIARPDVQAMSKSEIRAFNATVPSTHRYYIICRQSSVTGSLAKVTRVCLTREDRERTARDAQGDANNAVERGRASAGCDPYC